MKAWLILGGVAAQTLLGSAQPRERWNHSYRGQSNWTPNYILEINDGGFIMAGGTSDMGAGELDCYVVRIDAEGQVVWERAYGGEQDDNAVQLSKGKEGYIIFGVTESFGEGGLDFYAICIDDEGEELWSNHYGTDGYDSFEGAQPLTEGGWLLYGTTSPREDQEADIFVSLINDYGEELWARRYEREGDDCVVGAVSDQDEFVIAGAGIWPQESWNTYLMRIDSEGELSGLTFYGEFYATYPQKFLIDRDGDAVFVANAREIDENGEPVGDSFALVQKIGLDGEQRWETIVDEGDNCYCTDAVEARFGGFYLVGNTYNQQSGDDTFTARLSPEGRISWDHSIDEQNSCGVGNVLLATPEGGCVIVRTIAIPHPPMPMAMAACQVMHFNGAGREQWTWTSREYDPGWLIMDWNTLYTTDGGYLVSSAYGNMEVYRLGTDPVAVDLPDEFNTPVSLVLEEPYPNPFNGQINIPIDVNRTGMIEITLLDLEGRQVVNPINWVSASGRQTFVWSAKDIVSSAYWLKVKALDGSVQERKLVLVR